MTTRTTTEEQETRGLRGVLTMTAVTLALLGGALLWQTRSASETAAPGTTTAVGAPSEGTAPMGGLAESYRDAQQAAPSTTASAVPSIVIVGSQAAAARLRADLDGDTAGRDWIGLSPLDVQIIVAATDAEAEILVAAVHDVNRLRAGLGLPETTITDLR